MFRSAVWFGLLAAALGAGGCGNRDANPVGNNLVTRGEGRLVELPALPAQPGASRFEGALPLAMGNSEDLLVGRMNGLLFRSLVRVRVNADSLARAAGGAGAADLTVASMRFYLWRRSFLTRGEGGLAVHRPGQAWDEASVFADTLTFVERSFSSSPISGALAVFQADTLVRVDLPAAYVSNLLRTNPSGAQVDVLLAPAAPGDFLAGLVSRNDVLPGTVAQRPKVELVYTVRGSSRTYSGGVTADTYWGARDGAGPGPGTLLLSSGLRFSPIFRFNMPDSIPLGATVSSAQLLLDVDTDQSVFTGFIFGIDRVGLSADTGDTVFTRFNSWRMDPGITSFVLNQSLPQGWISNAAPNMGMALRSRNDARLSWILIRNPRLKLVYSIPPDL